MHIEVTNTQILAHILDTMNVEYEILSNKQANVFAKLSISEIVSVLEKEGCELLSMQENDETLESYYVSLVGGEKSE